MDNEEVSVTGDEENGEGGEEDAGGLDRPNQLAQNLLKKGIISGVFYAASNLPCSGRGSNSW